MRPAILAGASLIVAGVIAASSPVFATDSGEPQPTAEAMDPHQEVIKEIVFPVAGVVGFWNDWHQPRDAGTRLHLGTDIAAPKLTPVLAAVSGTIARIGPDGGRAGNYLVLIDAEGWEYAYLHLNNDSPGTDDNANPVSLSLGPGIEVGVPVVAGQVLGFVGDSGNAETTVPHLHFEIRTPEREPINPFPTLKAAWELDIDRRCDGTTVDVTQTLGRPAPAPHLVVTDRGAVVSIDGAATHGDLSALELDASIVAAASAAGGGGYWLLGADGGVFAFGGADFHGSIPGLLTSPTTVEAEHALAASLSSGDEIIAVDLVPTPDGGGYWILMANGAVIEFGDAVPISRPPVELAASASRLAVAPSGGAWIVAIDGGVFAVDGAPFHGSIPASPGIEATEIVAIIASRDATGYTLIDASGMSYDFGASSTTANHGTSQRCESGAVADAVQLANGGHRVLTTTGHIRTYGGRDPLDDTAGAGTAVALLVGPPVIGGLT